jgi:hypothetical protein
MKIIALIFFPYCHDNGLLILFALPGYRDRRSIWKYEMEQQSQNLRHQNFF